jgi:hypothetical protein
MRAIVERWWGDIGCPSVLLWSLVESFNHTLIVA